MRNNIEGENRQHQEALKPGMKVKGFLEESLGRFETVGDNPP